MLDHVYTYNLKFKSVIFYISFKVLLYIMCEYMFGHTWGICGNNDSEQGEAFWTHFLELE